MTVHNGKQPGQWHTLSPDEVLQLVRLSARLSLVRETHGPVYKPASPLFVGGPPSVQPGPGYNEFHRILDEISRIEELAVCRAGGFVLCSVQSEHGGTYSVQFSPWSDDDEDQKLPEDRVSLYSLWLGSDYDQLSFCVNCGVIDDEQEEDPFSLIDERIQNIWYCPDSHLDVAEFDETEAERIRREMEQLEEDESDVRDEF